MTENCEMNSKNEQREPSKVAPRITGMHQAYDDGGPCVHCGLPWDAWSQSPMQCPKHVYGVNTLTGQCKSCQGQGERYQSSDGCMGDSLYLPCVDCHGTGVHNEEKYREARIQGLRAAVGNLTVAVERHKQDVSKRIEKAQNELKGLEDCLEQRKKELADLESGKSLAGE